MNVSIFVLQGTLEKVDLWLVSAKCNTCGKYYVSEVHNILVTGKNERKHCFHKKNWLKQIYSMSHVIKPFLESLSRKRPLWDISKIILTLAEIKSQWLREIHVKTCEGPVGWLYHIWSHLTCCSIFTSSYMKY